MDIAFSAIVVLVLLLLGHRVHLRNNPKPPRFEPTTIEGYEWDYVLILIRLGQATCQLIDSVSESAKQFSQELDLNLSTPVHNSIIEHYQEREEKIAKLIEDAWPEDLGAKYLYAQDVSQTLNRWLLQDAEFCSLFKESIADHFDFSWDLLSRLSRICDKIALKSEHARPRF